MSGYSQLTIFGHHVAKQPQDGRGISLIILSPFPVWTEAPSVSRALGGICSHDGMHDPTLTLPPMLVYLERVGGHGPPLKIERPEQIETPLRLW